MKPLKSLMAVPLLLLSLNTFAQSRGGGGGDKVGGGGDEQEKRVNDIREDIQAWINLGGAKGLKLPDYLTLKEYNDKMTEVLKPQAVVVSFTDKDVLVNGKEKTCRGFLDDLDNKPNISCNIDRFKKTSESEQYVLIHHEYAGLVSVEKNDGAASDYIISKQITAYLKEVKVLKLAIVAPVVTSVKGNITNPRTGQAIRVKCADREKTDHCQSFTFFYVDNNGWKEKINHKPLTILDIENLRLGNRIKKMIKGDRDSVTGLAIETFYEPTYPDQSKFADITLRTGGAILGVPCLVLGLAIDASEMVISYPFYQIKRTSENKVIGKLLKSIYEGTQEKVSVPGFKKLLRKIYDAGGKQADYNFTKYVLEINNY